MARVRTQKRLLALRELVLTRRRDCLAGGRVETAEIIAEIRPAIKKEALKTDGVIDALVDFFIENMLPDNRSILVSKMEQHSFFALLDAHYLQYASAPLLKYRGEFTLFDLDQATRQKEANFAAVGLALRKWRWECSIIRPILVANPAWLYKDALAYLEANGGVPTPPRFDEKPRKESA